MVKKIRDNGLSLRKALDYSGCSNNLYYHKPEPRDIRFDQQKYWKRPRK